MRAWHTLLVPLLGWVGLSGCTASPALRRVPATLPLESVTTLDGEKTELSRLVQGRVALVSLWATWCTGCEKEVEALNRLAERAAARGDAVVVGVAVGEPRATVDSFVRRRGLRYTQVLDEDFHLADALGQRDVPATLVVDRTGRIVYRGEAFGRDGLLVFRHTLGEP
jgi:cytochrome c biogenesis protein CcmG, thiol:disulfide interchange protein DsbE